MPGKKLMPSIDSKNLSDTVSFLVDKYRFRKYADKNYVTVIWINSANTVIKLLDGKIDGLNLSIPCMGSEKLVNKVYILPTKKIVTRVVIVKEDLNSTLDILVTDISSINAALLKEYTKIKLMEGMTGFNIGQVVLGIAIGTILGFILNIIVVAVL
jgi:hypothetical protein